MKFKIKIDKKVITTDHFEINVPENFIKFQDDGWELYIVKNWKTFKVEVQKNVKKK